MRAYLLYDMFSVLFCFVRISFFEAVDVSFLSFLVGVIDGDGYIQARKKSNGYIEFNLVITFQNRDLATFEYILGKLHFGVIARIDSTLSKLVIYNFELKYVLVPLLRPLPSSLLYR